MRINEVKAIIAKIEMTCIHTTFKIRVDMDNVYVNSGRIFIQVQYKAPDSRTGKLSDWNGRKWYLSEHMTEDEIVKTCFAAFKAVVEHEVMEGFRYEDKIVFNPHVDFRELMSVSHKEIKRT